MPKDGLTLQDKQDTIKLLSYAGANICELNLVRTALSDLKGGKLARLAGNSRVVALVLSDIIGDPMHLIASGPTFQPPVESQSSALNILKKYELQSKLPPHIINCLENGGQEQPLTSFENVII